MMKVVAAFVDGQRGHRNRATLAVARKLVTYLLAVDKSGTWFYSYAQQISASLE